MEPITEPDFMTKVKAISRGSNGDLFKRLVDILYQQQENNQEYEDEPLYPDETEMVQDGLEAIQQEDKSKFISLEENENDYGC